MNNEQTNNSTMKSEIINEAEAILNGAIAKLEALTKSYEAADEFHKDAANKLDCTDSKYWKHKDASDAAFYGVNELNDTGLLEALQALQAKQK